jgi:hypothetical protein
MFELVCAISENTIVQIIITTTTGNMVDFFIARILEVYSYVNKLKQNHLIRDKRFAPFYGIFFL